jgi:hypothetical protein
MKKIVGVDRVSEARLRDTTFSQGDNFDGPPKGSEVGELQARVSKG